MVPVPVPVFVPVPMNMYSQYTPVPLAMPMPVPVPLVLPHNIKEMRDAAVQWEPLAEVEKGMERDKKIVSRGDQVSTHSGEAVTRLLLDSEDSQTEGNAGQADPRRTTAHEEESTESKDTLTMTTPGDPVKSTQTEHSHGTDDNTSSTSVDQQPPLSPMMDLESDLSPERYDLDQSAPSRRGLKRTRDSSHSRKRGKRRVLDRSALSTRPKLNHLYGIKAWGSWVQRHNAHADTEPRSSHTPAVKEDILQCDASELSYALCRFIKDVRRPNGGTYSADSIFYLCLGIQKYLFEKGRIENIFTDELYSQFSLEIANMLQHWKPELLPSGGLMPSRVQEAYLWDCKQLGAYSPVVLLNTLLFFCTKAFRFTTLAQHQQLSFANFTRSSRPCSHRGKTLYLQHRRGATAGHEATEGDLEIPENISSPLHCPVRLYEFYMSRCPDTVKNRTDIFYLQPEGSVHTNSSHWYTAKPLEAGTLQSMLTRILAVMEVQHDIFGLGST